MIVAERMCSRVEEVTRADDVPVTISIGVVSHQGAGPSVEGLILAADTAAHQAKASGRNAIAAAELADPVREAERVLRIPRRRLTARL